MRKSIHGEWSSRWAFILAATGSAVGLGNIWRFPYITGQYGGGAFVLLYIMCVLLIAMPIMICEIMLGRRGRQSPINTMFSLAEEEGLNKAWRYLGWLGVVAGFMILSFYSVIAGWTLDYIYRASSGSFSGVSDTEILSIFNGLLGNPELLIVLHTVFMSFTVIIVSMGVQSGLERAVKFLMPALFILLLIMVGYAMSTPAFNQGLSYLFKPDFSRLTGEGVLAAMGQAFFSLSLGMGAIMVYGSYLSSRASIVRTSISIVIMDTSVALLAGMAIFPLVFAYGLEPGSGPGLIFVTLPIAFGQMPYGQFFGTAFFVLLMFAAWTSSISLLEPAVAWLVENRDMKRVNAAALAGLLAWILGIGSVFSFNIWQDAKLFDKTYFDIMDYLTSNVMLPLGGLLIAIFSVWLMPRRSSIDELKIGDGLAYKSWRLLARYLAPVGVLIIFLNAIGIL
ncbi:MAG: sodium-dependent transporter [Gammaproteobacteria bacterium]|nr:sodium-dependent transporter [Gammaproteobacteria bacterium]NIQ09434.1 sodium-dependent transporter [Gammaproteobacteria bacterium]NIQ75788.1 sodium-dependent transporter [Gammaproteobacteria bacterium]NIR27015.1 sodium-dependent transporter [Gammaproteobacteria bacterium]NIR92988.1 sodium-dependent transporter [Gammaproteobacteria bacterium]